MRYNQMAHKMLRTRTEPRLNLRFKNHDILDEYELAALKKGMSLANWIKLILQDKIQSEKVKAEQVELELESILVIRKHVEDKQPKDVVAKVRAHVKDYLAKLKSYAAS